jgi:hypothetical protein
LYAQAGVLILSRLQQLSNSPPRHRMLREVEPRAGVQTKFLLSEFLLRKTTG